MPAKSASYTAVNVEMSVDIPDEWLRSEWTTQFFGNLASAPVAVLMLDYDGTLAPFRTERLRAVPYPGVKTRLEKLIATNRTRVVLISGRKAQELHDLLDMNGPIEIWGSHGREHLAADGSYFMEQLTAYEQAELARVRHALEAQFSSDIVEVKPNSVAVHWRRAKDTGGPDAVVIEQTMKQLCAHLSARQDGQDHEREGNDRLKKDGVVQLLSFDGGLELRAGTINKGHAVLRILEQFPSGTPAAFLGDDTTDEDAFAVLRDRGLAVLVRREPRETLARLWLSPPEDLLHFLDAWIAAVKSTV